MKKFALWMACLLFSSQLYAAEGEMGQFGGISTGVMMETWTSLAQTDTKKKTNESHTLPYKEMVYLSGEAVPVEGTIVFSPGKGVDKEKGEGTYTESYRMTASDAEGNNAVSRNVTLDIEYKYDPTLKQLTKNATIASWSETITAGGQTYRLDGNQSSFSKSVLENQTSGTLYYRGDVHYNAVYTTGGGGAGGEDNTVTVTVNAPIYGYEHAFSKSETQKRSITIDFGNGDGLSAEETPTFTVYRDMEYGSNEPTPISMAGNYKEVMRSEGVVSYRILDEEGTSGMVSVSNNPTVEQLSYPTALNLTGHPAATQIQKMFSLKLFTNDPKSFNPDNLVTKREYITMIAKAMQLELPEIEEEKTSKRSSKKKKEEVPNPFTDVKKTDPDYRYLVAAYNAGLISGGKLDANTYLTRELMYLINVRILGLERLGLTQYAPQTAYVDDNLIGLWAKPAIYSASKLGLIPVDNGYVYPKKTVTYAECATLLDQFIDYMRYDMPKEYIDKLLI